MTEHSFGFRKLHVESSASEVGVYLANWWLKDIQQSLTRQERYTVAVTGGTTPKEIYRQVAIIAPRFKIDWKRVDLLWTDERDVPLDHPDSNYRMAMECGLATLPIPKEQIYPMRFGQLPAPVEDGAAYNQICAEIFGRHGALDWIFLGLGDDGHTASLFPHSSGYAALPKASDAQNSNDCPFAVAHWVKAKDTWRMTLTLPFIHRARVKVGCVTGSAKASILAAVLRDQREPYTFPASWLGYEGTPITWVADADAAKLALE